jgi:hypothetical protein
LRSNSHRLARAIYKPVKGSAMKIYPGAPHGLAKIHKDKFNADSLARFGPDRRPLMIAR